MTIVLKHLLPYARHKKSNNAFITCNHSLASLNTSRCLLVMLDSFIKLSRYVQQPRPDKNQNRDQPKTESVRREAHKNVKFEHVVARSSSGPTCSSAPGVWAAWLLVWYIQAVPRLQWTLAINLVQGNNCTWWPVAKWKDSIEILYMPTYRALLGPAFLQLNIFRSLRLTLQSFLV